uniref:hypothetical protein n=1 Tax=Candidatus Electronema sp. TaxID=2698783 RepID=UPI0040559F84
MKSDVSTRLTHRISSILEDCHYIRPHIDSYLRETDARRDIDRHILRILSNSIATLEMFVPSKEGAEYHGLPREVCSPTPTPNLNIRHIERDATWDFQPWICEKLTRMNAASRDLAHYWLIEIGDVQLKPDAPMSPKKWLKGLIAAHFEEVFSEASIIFEQFCAGKIVIDEKG